MYICDVCNNPIEAGTQYVNVFHKNVCLDCAVRNTLDDVMATFGINYTEAPDEITVVATVDGQAIDATPEQVENFFHSENPVFVPTQVGEKNTVLTTLCARTREDVYKKAWVYESASDAEYWAEHYLKNMPNLISIDGFVSEEKIPDGYMLYRVDGDNDDGAEDDSNAIHEKNGWFYPGTDCRDCTEEMTDEEGERAYERAQENRKFW